MLKGDRKYYAIILFVLVVLFTIQQFQKEATNYDHTFSYKDKNPYGGYVLSELLPDFIGNDEIEHLNLTLYEIQDQLGPEVNLFILADAIVFDEQDTKVLLDAVAEGMTAFIGVADIAGKLEDTLGISRRQSDLYEVVNNQDTIAIRSESLEKSFRFKRDASRTYYNGIDSIDYRILARRDDNIHGFKVLHGKGELIISTMPLAFTNNYLFYQENADFAASILNDLPNKPTIWTEYYQLGRMVVQTPLRVVLTSPPLKLAYGLTMLALLLFMVFEAKRKQRIIPIITPLSNSTLTFVRTIGNLYLKSGDHKDIALKRIQYFHEFLREKYYLNLKEFGPDYFNKLSAKTGKDISEIKSLFDFMERIKQMPKVETSDLKKLNSLIESFYGRNN